MQTPPRCNRTKRHIDGIGRVLLHPMQVLGQLAPEMRRAVAISCTQAGALNR
jgi:hypothetical protein